MKNNIKNNNNNNNNINNNINKNNKMDVLDNDFLVDKEYEEIARRCSKNFRNFGIIVFILLEMFV